MRFDAMKVESFLHSKGYNYFNIGALTYVEVNDLVDVENQERAERKRESERKSRR